MTLVVIPVLTVLLALIEYKHKILQKYFKFMALPIGKGVYIVMMAVIISEKQWWIEIIIALVIASVGLFNIAVEVYRIVD